MTGRDDETQGDEEFVGEELSPVAGTGDAAMAARGEPGLPHRFRWRDAQYSIRGVLSSWKTAGPCRHGSGEQYVRRHWYRIVTDPPMTMTVYCDRQARDRRHPRRRWFVFSAGPVQKAGEAEG